MSQRRTKRLTFSRVLGNALLAALSARPAAALLTAPNVHLMTNVPAITPDMAIGSLTEAAYTGYATVALPAVAGPVREDDAIQSVIATVNFVAPSPLTTTATITGYYITDSTNAILYGAELFETPVPMVHPFDFLDLDIALPADLAVQLP